MKKKLGSFLLTGAMAICLCACGGKETTEHTNETEKTEAAEEGEAEKTEASEEVAESNFTEDQYLGYYKASDYVTLGEYIGVTVDVDESTDISDEDLATYINDFLAHNAVTKTVEDRTVQNGDVVNIDYVGKLDGVAFEGGTAQGYNLTIGSHTFIDGFEDGCIGMEIGETKDVETTFPDPYPNNPDLAGKKAIFTVTVNSITVTEIPELTDAFILEQEIEGVSTVEEYQAYAKEELTQQLLAAIAEEKADAAWQAAEENCEFQEPPAAIVDRMNDMILSNISTYASMYGMEVSEYVALVYGVEEEDYEETLRSSAEQMTKDYLMLQAIADQEGLNITDQEYEEKLAEDAAAYGQSVEVYKTVVDELAYREYLMAQKVSQFLGEHATVEQ